MSRATILCRPAHSLVSTLISRTAELVELSASLGIEARVLEDLPVWFYVEENLLAIICEPILCLLGQAMTDEAVARLLGVVWERQRHT